MKKIVTIAFLLIIASSMMLAQEKVTWQLEGAAGANVLYNNKAVAFGPTAHFGVDLLPIPQLLVRASLQAGSCARTKNDPNWIYGKNYFKGGVTLDVGWDIINTFNKNYRGTYHVQPYIRYQNIIASGNKNAKMVYSLGAGLRQTVDMTERVSLLIDCAGVVTDEYAWTHKTGIVGFAQVFVGVAYKLQNKKR